MLLKPYLQLMRLDKPIGIYLLMWPTLWALWFANHGVPSTHLLFIFIAGVIVMRSAGCVINDICDRNLDPKIKRTAKRPLADKQVTVKQALSLFFTLIIFALALVLMLNLKSLAIAVIAAIFSILYPLMKRVTYLPQFVLGLTFYLGVLMAFTASVNALPFVAWILFLSVVCWTIAFDTMYAMVDMDDDIKIGVKSTALLFGRYCRVIIALFQILFFVLMLYAGFLVKLSLFYYIALSFSSSFLLYQQYLLSLQNRESYLKAFLNNHWLGLTVFVITVFAFA